MLKLFCPSVVALTALTGITNAQDANESAKKGAAAYQLCAACHSLQPGVHLSGPSLANLWSKRAATISDFGRYTDTLKKTEIVWGENTLYAWVADPQAMFPGPRALPPTGLTLLTQPDRRPSDSCVSKPSVWSIRVKE